MLKNILLGEAKMNKSIDIIVPVWNGSQYIADFIDKLLNQSYKNFKVYFVDDGSDDNSLELLQQYQNLWPDKIFVLHNSKKSGQGIARDCALNSGYLNGDYIIFLDIDDYPEHNFLEVMVNTAEHYQVDVVMCGFECFDDTTGKIISVQMIHNPENVITDISEYIDIAYMNPAVWNKLYRREVIEKYRFGKVEKVEDGLFLLRILPNIHSIKFINKVLYHYRISNNSSQARVSSAKFEICWHYYKDMSSCYSDHTDIYKNYVTIFELMTFIKCGIGLTHRVAFKDMKHLNYYASYSKKMLDELVPGWRKNRHLLMRYWRERSIKANMVALCASLYRFNLFGMFIVIYWIYKKVCGKDVRW